MSGIKKSLGLLVFLLLAVVNGASAYPASVLPIDRLIDGADLVIEGNVTRVDELSGPFAIAYIHVSRYLKGHAAKDTLGVLFSYISSEDGPEVVYRKRTTVLTFLNGKDSLYEPYGKVDSIKVLTPGSAEAYRKMVENYMLLNRIADTSLRKKAKINWLLNSLSDSATKADAAAILVPSFFGINAQGASDIKKTELNDNQTGLIKNAVFQDSLCSFSDIALIRYILPEYSSQLQKWVAWQLPMLVAGSESETNYINARKLIQEVSSLFPDNIQLKNTAGELLRLDLRDKKNREKAQPLVKSFNEQLARSCHSR